MRAPLHLLKYLIEQPTIKAGLYMLRGGHRTVRPAGEVDTTLQEKPFDQLTGAEGEIAGTNIYHNLSND